jgi:Clp amino terminal domain, pathogenicity island component
MFERFTGRARHVVVLAQEEARLLNHNYIGTEHILLGLLGEPDSVGGQVLASFGLTRDGAREEVLAKVGRGKKQLSGHIPFTPRAKKTLELSLREALAIKHNYIGTEHILLGLIREGDGVAAQILREHADLLEIRVAVLNAVSADPAGAGDGGEEGEGAEDTNAVLRWLRARLSRHGATSLPFRPDVPGAEPGTRGTPAAEAALQQAARLAGPLPVGSHHLLLAALADGNSAASAALTSLGVDLDELREKLRSASVTGTSDEQPEQAGRRQMAIQVTDEILTIVLTDPVIVEAGKEALRAVNARAAAGAKSAAGEGAGGAGAGAETSGEGLSSGEPSGAAPSGAGLAGTGLSGAGATGTEGASATSTVIRGDNPHAVGLASVWLELRKTLTTLADPLASTRSVRFEARPPGASEPGERSGAGEAAGPAERSGAGEADEPGETGS